MRITAAIVLTLTTFVLQGGTAKQKSQITPCVVVQEALSDYQRLKPGMTRKDIGKDFVPDGGVQFFGSTRYVYTKCVLLQMTVEFSSSQTGSTAPPSPDDKIVTVSNLIVTYPAKD
jgi:hypothetical protein